MYAKVFTQIYDGTLCTKGPWEALVTFQQLLVLADLEGNVDMTAPAISRRTTIPLNIITKGINALLQPDPESRTPDEEGRRILPLSEDRNWGWRIVNYNRYRELKKEEDRREYHRNYWNKRKEKPPLNTDSTPLNNTQQDSTHSTHTEAEAEANAKALKTNTPARKLAMCLPNDFTISERVRNWAAIKGHSNLERRLEHFAGWAKASGKKYIDWEQAFMNAIRDDWAKVGKTLDYAALNLEDGV